MVANIENAFKFVFKDKNWIIKILVGGLLLIIPVVNFIVFGYILMVLKDAKEGKEAALPEWGEWGNLFKAGFMCFIVGLIYFLILFGLWFFIGLLSAIPIVGCISIFLIPIIMIYAILLPTITNIALCRYLEGGVLEEAFKLKSIYEEFKSKVGDYAVITLIYAGISMVAPMALCLMPIVYFWLGLITVRIIGEIYGTKPTRISA